MKFGPLTGSIVVGLWLSCSALGDTLTQSMSVATDIQNDGVKSQQKIEQIARQTDARLQEYQRLVNDTDYQTQYRQELQQLLQQQSAEMESLKSQLDSVQYTQQRMLPLLRSMLEALARFVALDLPFHHTTRIEAVARLKDQINNLDLSPADKLRMVMELFQVELAYGNTLESYREPMLIDGELRSVDFLRVGRLGLYYQTLDGEQSAAWDNVQQQWHLLPEQANHAVGTGMRIAKNQLAPQLLLLPLQKTGEVTP